MSRFLATTRQLALTSGAHVKGKNIVFVMGNEAGDLDTICSSILYAFSLSQTLRNDYCPQNPTSCHNPDSTMADAGSVTMGYVPLMPFVRADFRLRRDAVWVFRQAGFAMRPDES